MHVLSIAVGLLLRVVESGLTNLCVEQGAWKKGAAQGALCLPQNRGVTLRGSSVGSIQKLRQDNPPGDKVSD